MKKPSSAAIARENLSRLASIGIGSMEVEELRVARQEALNRNRAARRGAWEGDSNRTMTSGMSYAMAVRAHKNARERHQREVKRYRKWLAEVMA